MRRISIAICFFLALAVAAAPRSVRDGVYTKAQADRGQATYRSECARCHGETLLGGDEAPALVGADFLEKWNGNPAFRLFELIRRTMPSDAPGTISARQSSDLLAYILSANELPAGQKELETDAAALNEIRIEPKQ
jgi:mono/diheme cytochrome c family protein